MQAPSRALCHALVTLDARFIFISPTCQVLVGHESSSLRTQENTFVFTIGTRRPHPSAVRQRALAIASRLGRGLPRARISLSMDEGGGETCLAVVGGDPEAGPYA